jgi:hypothetical protein
LYICERVQFRSSRIIDAFHARHRALCALARSNAAGTRVQTSEQRKRLEAVLGRQRAIPLLTAPSYAHGHVSDYPS